MSQIKTICVCGAGTMGSGIAQVAARAGFNTILYDLNTIMLEKSKVDIERGLQKLTQKGKISEFEKVSSINRIQYTHEIHNCIADLIIEAIIEKKEAKVALFHQLSIINKIETIFASNTSSIAISELAIDIAIPSRVVGMHFFNPAPIMKLVEVVKANETNESVVNDIVKLAVLMGKTPVVCKDSPGFIVNRVARHYYLEAMKLVELNLASIETIDTIMESTGFKMGPFALMDLIGIDINYGVSNIVWESLGKPERLMPSFIQKQKVELGELGKKTKKGFYTYDAQ